MGLRKYINSLRQFRVWHRLFGISLATLLLISAVTGVLLALKKDIELLQPKTYTGSSKDLSTWRPISDLAAIATEALCELHPDQKGNTIDRIDARPSKGIAKVIYEKAYWEVQIDGATGEVKSIAKRHSDWIEHIHDGSIVSDPFKLISMNILGVGVILLILTGTWLWYGPKRIRGIKRRRS